jgi:uncharacterized phiE125 gp8 family phage protein
MSYPYPWPYEQLKMSIVRASAADYEPISLVSAKAFLQVSHSLDDDLINSLIKAAREYAEKKTGRSLSKKDYILALNRFPNLYCDGTTAIDLWPPPLTECNEIKYIGTDGIEHPLNSGTGFQVDFASEPARVAPAPGQCWPVTLCGALNAVRVFFTAGYEPRSSESLDQDIAVNEPEAEQVFINSVSSQVTDWDIDRTMPNDLLTALKQLVLHWYRNRDVVIAMPGAGGVYAPLPVHLDEIISQHRVMNLAMTFPQ